jgi:hypothetical protein
MNQQGKFLLLMESGGMLACHCHVERALQGEVKEW